MKVSINLRLSLGKDHYDVNLDLPGSNPTAESPFLFGVNQVQFKVKADPKDKDIVDDDKTDKLLQVAIGGKDQLYVAVKPPQSLIHAAGVDKVIQNLEVLVAEGEYFPKDHKFKAKDKLPPA